MDLVVCGHEHDYERSYAVRGTVSGSETLAPDPVSTEASNIDTGRGTVHMVLGGGNLRRAPGHHTRRHGQHQGDLLQRDPALRNDGKLESFTLHRRRSGG